MVKLLHLERSALIFSADWIADAIESDGRRLKASVLVGFEMLKMREAGVDECSPE